MKDFKDAPNLLKVILKFYFMMLCKGSGREEDLENEDMNCHLQNAYLNGIQLYEMERDSGRLKEYLDGKDGAVKEFWVERLSDEIKQSMIEHFKDDFQDESFGQRHLTNLMHQFGYVMGYEVSKHFDEYTVEETTPPQN